MPNKQRLGEPLDIPLSLGWRAGDFVFTSGQVPQDESGRFVGGTIEEQTHATLKRIEMILGLAGCTLADVVKTTVFLLHMRDYAEMNEAYVAAFGETRPARSAVAVVELPVGALVEVEAWAFVRAD